MPYRLSPSSLNLFKECSRCFWLTIHKVWKRPVGIFPSLPGGMDRVLKNHFDKFMNEGKMPPELAKYPECKNLKLFDEENLLATWRNNFEGISWTDKKGNELCGAVDNILVNKINERLIVLDYKTRGFPVKDNTSDYYQLQLDIYNFLLRKNDYETENYSYILFYVPKEVGKSGEVIFNTTLKKIEINVGNAEKTWKQALILLEKNCPDEKCDWCRNFILKNKTL